jgi:hypothetical protein
MDGPFNFSLSFLDVLVKFHVLRIHVLEPKRKGQHALKKRCTQLIMYLRFVSLSSYLTFSLSIQIFFRILESCTLLLAS